MNTPSPAVAHFRASAHALLQAGLSEIKASQHDEYQAIALAANQGSFFRVNAAMSPAGLFECSIDLVSPSGQSLPIIRTGQDQHGAGQINSPTPK